MEVKVNAGNSHPKEKLYLLPESPIIYFNAGIIIGKILQWATISGQYSF
jgi:hypothetical protein